MECTVLASGSSGNCIYVNSGGSALLIDAGLSKKEILARLACAGLDHESVDAILLTHEHTDHVRGAEALARSLNLPLTGTGGTLTAFRSTRQSIKKPAEARACRYNTPFTAGEFEVTPFAVSHDAAEPCGYSIRSGETILAIMTDTGIVTPQMMHYLEAADGIVLESNHCPDMLKTGPYPDYLKRRIRGKSGHLSNTLAAECIRSLKGSVSTIILSHLSEINNTPTRAFAESQDALGLDMSYINLRVASPDIGCSCLQKTIRV
ncbi:MAG: MBL fold metallo-hydrolase [Methanocalculus sp. MSAO_Arc1]|uniref:MBL fold metallo-hydrolase n=1 Tax=Methanocalculus TaxID=71151 RepID=UPI000FF255FF|nr:MULTISPECIES: MBL fold metallo-hydrolase [unclassified Methanocalculus]MCP1662179.1 phosphoribosyl 1,2-cyclic phosphodiesterase [Methanocalculus sp. AMF5]RQD79093.1 MAG: MBL fold metallo-hydrolase [Methanocalculus sp. MSAO_Arc1]